MTEALARGGHGEALHARASAYAVMAEMLRIQGTARRRSWLGRVFGQNPIEPDARSWYRGALGELAVARMLASLPAGWTVLRYSPAALEDTPAVDHVLIGPAGVFTISTRNHVGQRVQVGDDRMLVNGHRTNHIADGRHDATRISRLLGAGDDGPVTPVIAIVSPRAIDFDRKRPDRLLVIRASRLTRTLLRQPRTASDAAVAALVRRAESGGTWTSATSALDETVRNEARFLRLKREVDAALRRRVGWGAAVIVSIMLLGLAVNAVWN